MDRMYGITIMTNPLTPGLPLFNSSGKLVGIHKFDGTVTVEKNK